MLFLDIETVAQVWNFSEVDERTQNVFKKKFRKDIAERSNEAYPNNQSTSMVAECIGHDRACDQIWKEQAAFHAEFAKIVCVSFGEVVKSTVSETDSTVVETIYTKSIYNHNEKMLIKDVVDLLNKKPEMDLCAHNGKGFDFPFLSKKILIHGMQLPRQLNIVGLKPWEFHLVDTADLWRFGNFKDYTSLESIANCFGLPSPKEEMDGSMVGPTYYGQDDQIAFNSDDALKKICKYCEYGDVVTLVNVHRCIKGLAPITNHKSLTL